MRKKLGAILRELRVHAPFTLFGAVTGLMAMFLFARAPSEVSHRLFQVFHPLHVALSAIVTASLFRLHERKRGFLVVLVVGYLGAIGVATLSDSVLPFVGESILGVAVPTHAHEHAPSSQAAAHDHDHNHDHDHDHAHRPHLYLGFLEDWYLVTPAAILGILIAWFRPHTRFPHAGHILISTWASSFHMLMNARGELTPLWFLGAFLVLFFAVWLPCCVSDIIFPMLFVRSPHLHLEHHHQAQEVEA